MAEVNTEAAAAFVREMEEACRLCVERSAMSQACDELSSGLRFLPVEGYVIFHRWDGLLTKIVRILRDPRIVGMSDSPAAGAASGNFFEFVASLEELEQRMADADDGRLVDSAEFRPAARVYSVPRRFGLGSLFVVVAFFAVLFGVMRLFMAPPVVMAYVGLQVVAAGVMQWFFRKHPRLTSAMAGAVLLPVTIICYAAIDRASEDAFAVVAASPCIAIFGAFCGYAAGTLIAGVFMVMEWADKTIAGRTADGDTDDTPDPFAAEPKEDASRNDH